MCCFLCILYILGFLKYVLSQRYISSYSVTPNRSSSFPYNNYNSFSGTQTNVRSQFENSNSLPQLLSDYTGRSGASIASSIYTSAPGTNEYPRTARNFVRSSSFNNFFSTYTSERSNTGFMENSGSNAQYIRGTTLSEGLQRISDRSTIPMSYSSFNNNFSTVVASQNGPAYTSNHDSGSIPFSSSYDSSRLAFDRSSTSSRTTGSLRNVSSLSNSGGNEGIGNRAASTNASINSGETYRTGGTRGSRTTYRNTVTSPSRGSSTTTYGRLSSANTNVTNNGQAVYRTEGTGVISTLSGSGTTVNTRNRNISNNNETTHGTESITRVSNVANSSGRTYGAVTSAGNGSSNNSGTIYGENFNRASSSTNFGRNGATYIEIERGFSGVSNSNGAADEITSDTSYRASSAISLSRSGNNSIMDSNLTNRDNSSQLSDNNNNNSLSGVNQSVSHTERSARSTFGTTATYSSTISTSTTTSTTTTTTTATTTAFAIQRSVQLPSNDLFDDPDPSEFADSPYHNYAYYAEPFSSTYSTHSYYENYGTEFTNRYYHDERVAPRQSFFDYQKRRQQMLASRSEDHEPVVEIGIIKAEPRQNGLIPLNLLSSIRRNN